MKTNQSQAAELFRRSFTLTELLVAMAIIMILIAMLSPALREVRLKARDIECGQNSRQIHLAVMLYADDHEGLYLRTISQTTQYEQILLLSNYIAKLDFYRCPLSRGDVKDPAWSNAFHTPFPVGGAVQWTEYKLNEYHPLTNAVYGAQLRPSKMVIVMDAIDWAPRHRGKSNLCFYDGHVELLTQAEYAGPEPGSPTGDPFPWFKWGMEPY